MLNRQPSAPAGALLVGRLGDAQRNRKKVTCRGYVIVVRFLKRCANNFS